MVASLDYFKNRKFLNYLNFRIFNVSTFRDVHISKFMNLQFFARLKISTNALLTQFRYFNGLNRSLARERDAIDARVAYISQ